MRPTEVAPRQPSPPLTSLVRRTVMPMGPVVWSGGGVGGVVCVQMYVSSYGPSKP